MNLALPKTLSGIARVKLDIERVDYSAPEASGRQGGVQAGFPLWAVRLELDRVDPASADLWCAFIDRLRGRMRRFACGDPARPHPIKHAFGMLDLARADGTAFDGTAITWSQTIDALLDDYGLAREPVGISLDGDDAPRPAGEGDNHQDRAA
ncbi:MAG: hypothetical protein AAFR88_09695, partial [Pseudomonadota bacterium]